MCVFNKWKPPGWKKLIQCDGAKKIVHFLRWSLEAWSKIKEALKCPFLQQKKKNKQPDTKKQFEAQFMIYNYLYRQTPYIMQWELEINSNQICKQKQKKVCS